MDTAQKDRLWALEVLEKNGLVVFQTLTEAAAWVLSGCEAKGGALEPPQVHEESEEETGSTGGGSAADIAERTNPERPLHVPGDPRLHARAIGFLRGGEYTQTDIAAMLGVSSSYVSNVLNGRRGVTRHKLHAWTKLLGDLGAGHLEVLEWHHGRPPVVEQEPKMFEDFEDYVTEEEEPAEQMTLAEYMFELNMGIEDFAEELGLPERIVAAVYAGSAVSHGVALKLRSAVGDDVSLIIETRS